MSLKQSATSSIKWSSISQVARQVMQFVTIAIFARLLSPTDFGLVGMATLVIGFVDLFKDLGTSAAVIQRKNISDELLYSIFWINVIFGLLGMVILFFCSPLVAIFYKEPEVDSILKVLSVSFLLSGISILQKAILEKKLAFNTLAKVEISAIFCGAFVGIGAALMGFRVWSLVAQTLTVVAVTTVLLWSATRWKPKMIFSWNEVKEISGYSLNLTGFNTFNYFVRNADYLLIGKFLGSQSLGYYTLAYRLMLYPLQNISHVISRVMFPVFSKIQDDDAKLRTAYLKVVGMISMITFPIMFGLWAMAEPFILTVFGRQWQPVILLLMILVPVGMSQSLETTVGTIYQTKGRTDWQFRFSLLEGTLFIIAWIIGLQWGIYGVASAYASAYFLLVYPNYAIPFRLIQLKVIELVKVILRPLFASLFMLLVLLGLRFVLPIGLSSGWILGILVPTGCITYLVASWLINREQINQLLLIVGLKR